MRSKGLPNIAGNTAIPARSAIGAVPVVLHSPAVATMTIPPCGRRDAEAAEAAAEEGAFWAMHDLLLRHQDALLMPDLIRYATESGLDPGRFRDQLASRAEAARVAEDVDSADLSGVSGTPTFFINGRRHYGSYDIAALTAAVQAAKAASLASRLPAGQRRGS